MNYRNLLLSCCLFALAPVAMATPATDAEFAVFKAAGAGKFSAERGKQDWDKVFVGKQGDKRSCTTCHGQDLAKPGKHVKTRKVIQPMAASVNPKRYTEQKKIEKWFKRNCEWVRGRECTAQEKGDILEYLLSVK
jgi:hypothetical protein